MSRSLFPCSGSWLTVAAMSLALPPVLGCGQNDNECMLNPQRCDMAGLKVNPGIVELNDSKFPINQAFQITKDTPWPWLSNGLDVCLIDKGNATACTQKANCDLTVPANHATRPSDSEYSTVWPMPLFSQVKEAKTYCLEMRFGATPLLAGTPVFAELRVIPKKPVLLWKELSSNPLAIIPNQPLANPPNLTVRGLWLGRGGSDLASTELLLLQGYTTITGGQVAAIRRSTASNPAMSWVETSNGAGSLFSAWRFGAAAEVQNPRVVLWNETSSKQYAVTYGGLQNPEPTPESRGQVTMLSVSTMAIAMLPGSSTFAALAQTDSGIKSFISTGPSSLIERSVRNEPGVQTLSRMTGYADKVDGTGTVGVLGFTAVGEPALFKWDGTEFSYDPRSEEIRKMGQVGMANTDAVAVGDVDGNGYNDIVVARGGKVKFFLQIDGSFVPSSTEVTVSSGVNIGALVIGQLDGLGKPDLAVADANPRKCAVSDCNHVYVYLNQMQ